MKRGRKSSTRGANVVHPNVSRVDYDSNHGYSVRVARQGKEISKLFSDGVYGGKRKAKAAAIEWREATVKRVGEVAPGSHGVPAKPPGYSYIKRKSVPRIIAGVKRKVMCWVGFLRIEERRHLSTTWSIGKWGSEAARAGCATWLAEKKAELFARLGQAAPAKPSKTKSKAKQLGFPTCGACGGVLLLMTGPGRKYSYRGRLDVMIPEDFPTMTCMECGEIYMNDREAEDLEKRVERAVKKTSKRTRS